MTTEQDIQAIVQEVLSARVLASLRCSLCGWLTSVAEPPRRGMAQATEWLEVHYAYRHPEIVVRDR